uniref:Arylsulfatase F n=1 Tax=Molossus molossus TaxID=27622 RepID=A0A7J8J6Q3_MOLMO|nr:hypothetical protein HJG59_009711 [Molossus molossus]
MPFTLVEPCWPDPSRDTELAVNHKVWLIEQLVLVAAFTLTVGKLSRLIWVPWSLILFMVLLICLLSYSWLSSYTSSLYWDCVLMREHKITEQPMKAARAGSIMVKEAILFFERSRHHEGPFLLFYSFLHVQVPLPTTKDFIGTSKQIFAVIDDLGLRNHTFVYFASDHTGYVAMPSMVDGVRYTKPPGAQACYETQLCQCVGKNVTYHDPPLLFNLSRDPSESTPLTNDTEPLYDLMISTVADALMEHKKSITPVELQLGTELNHERVSLKSCCGVFPFCLCDKEEGEGNIMRSSN